MSPVPGAPAAEPAPPYSGVMQVDPHAPELAETDFYTMLRASRMCILVHDAATKNILWANPAACELLEWSVTELRPLKADHMSSTAQQYDRVLGRAWLERAVQQGTSRIQWDYRSKSGRVIPTDAIATLVELDHGPAVLVQFRDIEREQQIERELRLTTSYVETLSRHTAAGYLVLSPDGIVQHATNRALDQFGTGRKELAGRPLEDFCTIHTGRGDGPRYRGWAAAVRVADPIGAIRLRLPGGGGRPDWLGGTVELMHQPGVDELVMTVHDISERVRDEEQRGRALEQENYLARYNAMGDMAMAIAHELGQPLAAARNFLAGVRARTRAPGGAAADPGDQVAYGLDAAERQIERAAAIVGAVRAFVGHLEHVSGAVDLREVVEQCLYFVRLRADAAGVAVEVEEGAAPVTVVCERVLTGQVVLNLCFNAIEELAGCPPEGRVLRIGTRLDESGGGPVGLLTVDDRGRGLQRDPFAESFTSKEHGSGIGLALSYRIITRQHGAIWAEERPGGGTRFAFTLPAAGAERPA
ncbi:hypothetical protein GCM10027440_02360 [Nocardiopsis coralliicola]